MHQWVHNTLGVAVAPWTMPGTARYPLKKKSNIREIYVWLWKTPPIHVSLLFVSSANTWKDWNSSTLVVFSQSVRMSSYKGHTNCSCSFPAYWNKTIAVYRAEFARRTKIKTPRQTNVFQYPIRWRARSVDCSQNQSQLQKLGWRSVHLLSFEGWIKIALTFVPFSQWCRDDHW